MVRSPSFVSSFYRQLICRLARRPRQPKTNFIQIGGQLPQVFQFFASTAKILLHLFSIVLKYFPSISSSSTPPHPFHSSRPHVDRACLSFSLSSCSSLTNTFCRFYDPTWWSSFDLFYNRPTLICWFANSIYFIALSSTILPPFPGLLSKHRIFCWPLISTWYDLSPCSSYFWSSTAIFVFCSPSIVRFADTLDSLTSFFVRCFFSNDTAVTFRVCTSLPNFLLPSCNCWARV